MTGKTAKKRRFVRAGLWVLLALIVILSPRAHGQTSRAAGPVSGIVTYVYDGDTIRVRLQSGEEKRVRLIGVDSPELDDPKEASRLWGFLARRFAHAALYRKPVRLTRDREEVDAYGRLLGYVWIEGQKLFNEALVRAGYARAYLRYPFDEAVKARLLAAEAEARAAGRGLWRSKPWDVVGPAEAGRRRGEVVTVRFVCVRVFDRGRYEVLVPSEGDFEAVCPRDVLATFPGSLDFERRTIEVTGLVEEFNGRPQIMIGLSAQVKVAGNRSAAADSRPPAV